MAPRPAFWEVVKKMKWEAWSRLGNMSQEEAMNNYVEELKKVRTNGLPLFTTLSFLLALQPIVGLYFATL